MYVAKVYVAEDDDVDGGNDDNDDDGASSSVGVAMAILAIDTANEPKEHHVYNDIHIQVKQTMLMFQKELRAWKSKTCLVKLFWFLVGLGAAKGRVMGENIERVVIFSCRTCMCKPGLCMNILLLANWLLLLACINLSN